MRKLKLNEFNKTSGTSYQGSIMTSLSNLKNIFEAPSVTYADIDSKTRNEYLIEFDDGLVATIYDYKEYRAYETMMRLSNFTLGVSMLYQCHEFKTYYHNIKR